MARIHRAGPPSVDPYHHRDAVQKGRTVWLCAVSSPLSYRADAVAIVFVLSGQKKLASP
jgi:hypothetical protein